MKSQSKTIRKQLRNSSRVFIGVSIFQTKNNEWRALFKDQSGQLKTGRSNSFKGIISTVNKERVRETK
jgi:hypothetical protein